MTCIAAVAHNGVVWMGGDALGVDVYDFTAGAHVEPKVWRSGPILFGAAGSFRVAQLIRHRMTIPTFDRSADPLGYLVGDLSIAIRETLEMGGALTRWQEDATEELTGSSLLIALVGRVFEMYADFGVGELAYGYATVGSGSPIAMGVLAATERLKVSPRRRVELALDAAERHNAAVRGPMTILRLPPG